MKTNYHTHTIRCKHAVGADESYVKSAILAGFDELGFSDHVPWPFEDGFTSKIRMTMGQYRDYVDSILLLKEKYRDKIRICLGLECEYFEEYKDWLIELKKSDEIEYLIFGNHFAYPENSSYYEGYYGECIKTTEDLEKYKNATLKGIESGLFAYVAHPDLFMRCYPEFDSYCEKISEEICKKAKEKNILLEYNISGFPYCEKRGYIGYPAKKFWEIAKEYDCKCIIGYDAHDNYDLEQEIYWNKGIKMIEEIGIQRVERLSF